MIPNALAATAGLLLVAAITPGPNNLAVLRAAEMGGAYQAWPAIAGITLGGTAMLVVTITVGSPLAEWAYIRAGVAAGGAAYLAWLGLAMIFEPGGQPERRSLPVGFFALFGFQFLNPKSWVMVLSLVTAFPPMPMHLTFAWLVPFFLVIPTACLLLWAAAGVRLATHLRTPKSKRHFDQLMGVALVTSAALLLL